MSRQTWVCRLAGNWITALSLVLMLFAAPAIAQDDNTIRRILVQGNQRIEPETVASYLIVRPGDPFDERRIDQSLKALFATGLFADVRMEKRADALVVVVQENPIINRIVFEGNKRIKQDDLSEEVQLRPRIVYTRAKVRADVERMLELYRRKGRFAAIIEPKVIQLEQNRVDLIFEISEGPKTKIKKINFIGNEEFSSRKLRGELATKESRWWKIFTSNDTYDPDRLAFDREVLRQYYLQEGYADFRVVSSVAELTPDRDSFLMTFVVEEGEIYDFGEIELDSEIRDIDNDAFKGFLLMREGERYNAKKIEDTIELLTNAAGLLGYAFVDVRPRVRRDRETRRINITFRILEAPRTYVERIDIHGNIRTLDKVIRREFRLVEGDAFNSSRLRRSEQRIKSLGFFREELAIEQIPGTKPDRVILDVSVQEQPTGELSIGAGFSSLENFLLDLSIAERNLLGRGQELRLGFRWSSRSQNIDLGFTEPYFLGRNISAGADIFRSNLDLKERRSLNVDEARNSTFKQATTGGRLRLAFPLTEYWGLATNYTIRFDDVSYSEEIRPFLSRFQREQEGKFTTSSVGFSLFYDLLNNRLRPTSGQRFVVSQSVAGLGGNIRYLQSTVDYDKYIPLFSGLVLRVGAEAGYIFGFGQDIRINNRFFLGSPRMRGFATAGLGPREILTSGSRDLTTGEFFNTSSNSNRGAIGGNVYYLTGAELKLPLGAAARELGIEASAFVDVGALWNPDISNDFVVLSDGIVPDEFRDPPVGDNALGPIRDEFLEFVEIPGFDAEGNPITTLQAVGFRGIYSSSAPRISVGIGFSWDSPFGPFRIDLAKTIKQEVFDRTETLQFNIGTRF